ncbi:hypothetical protein [Lactobacillus crispatus]|uniref:hypothetical protein n=1 Tax=Lactobacillus crispatus TaxID=47770 RepID=UPI003FA5A622
MSFNPNQGRKFAEVLKETSRVSEASSLLELVKRLVRKHLLKNQVITLREKREDLTPLA